MACWIGRLADEHPLVGHGATRRSAAPPSMSGPQVHPAMVFAADVGVRGPTRGLIRRGITIRIVLSRLDSLRLTCWLTVLMMRWRVRSGTAAANLLLGSFSVLYVLVVIVIVRYLVAATTAPSSSNCADYVIPHCGMSCQADVEAPLPRAAPTPVVRPMRATPGAGTFVTIIHVNVDWASVLDGDMPATTIVRSLRARAAGVLALGYAELPRSQWSRLSAWPLTEAPTTNWIPAQAWASSRRWRGGSGQGGRTQEGGTARILLTRRPMKEKKAR